MGILIFLQKGSFFLPGVMWAKFRVEGLGLGVWGERAEDSGLGLLEAQGQGQNCSPFMR